MISKQVRKNMEDKIYKTFDLLDPTGTNTMYYKQKYSKMSDTQFEKEMRTFLNTEDENFYLEINPYVIDLKMSNINKAAKYLKLPLYEHVSLPFAHPDSDEVYWTPVPVPVFPIHIKRVQQLVSKKNSLSIHTENRSPKTGQVTGYDKNGRSSDVENIALIAMDADATLKEMTGARSDDLNAKAEMAKAIAKDGYVSLKDLPSNKADRVALNTLDVYFTACGIKTDLITNGLLLPHTLKTLNNNKNTLNSKYTKDE